MIKAIIFDFDGVIGDTFDISFNAAIQLNPNITKDSFVDLFVGDVYKKALELFSQKDIPIFFEKQKKAFTRKNFFPVEPMLEKLSQRYRLFIISGTVDENINYFLSLGKLNKYFQKILGATTSRSKLEKFKMLYNEFNFRPEECLFVTDTVGDVMDGKEANVYTIAVSWGYHSEKLLLEHHPSAIVHSIDELLVTIGTITK